jgi:hypothetical protein
MGMGLWPQGPVPNKLIGNEEEFHRRQHHPVAKVLRRVLYPFLAGSACEISCSAKPFGECGCDWRRWQHCSLASWLRPI